MSTPSGTWNSRAASENCDCIGVSAADLPFADVTGEAAATVPIAQAAATAVAAAQARSCFLPSFRCLRFNAHLNARLDHS
ncbi:hypothetical protein [Streptomyces beijiangensis]|uniref:hypothetical protein n=1 Tax=Streptomyces beijiangensis TaxID=163361 RepID=UPI003379D8AE